MNNAWAKFLSIPNDISNVIRSKSMTSPLDKQYRDDVEYNGKKYYVSTAWLIDYFETMVFEYDNHGEIDWSGVNEFRTTCMIEAIANHAKVIELIKSGVNIEEAESL